MSGGFSIGSNHSLFNISLDKAKGKNKPDNKIDYTEIVEAIRIGSTEEKDAAFKLISGLVNSSRPEDKKLWENFCALLSKDLDKKKNPAIEILTHLAKTAPDKAAELFKSVKPNNKKDVINSMGCFNSPPLNNTEKENVVKFLSEIAKEPGAEKYLLKDSKPSEAAKFLFDNLDLAEGKNKSQTAKARYDSFSSNILKKVCLEYIGKKENPTNEQKDFFKMKVNIALYVHKDRDNNNVSFFNKLSDDMKIVYLAKMKEDKIPSLRLKPGKNQSIFFSDKVIDSMSNEQKESFVASGNFSKDITENINKKLPLQEIKDKNKTEDKNTKAFNGMSAENQAAVLNKILKDDELDLKDIFVLKDLKIDPKTFALLTQEEKTRLLNADGATMFNRVGEYFNAKTAAALSIHAETDVEKIISKAEKYQEEYPKSTIAQRQKAVEMLDAELAEVETAIEKLKQSEQSEYIKKMIVELETNKNHIKNKQKLYIDSTQPVSVGVVSDQSETAGEIKDLNENIIEGNYNTNNTSISAYQTELEKADLEIMKIEKELRIDNYFISDTDQNAWNAIKNTLLSLGVSIDKPQDDVASIQRALAKLGGKKDFNEFRSYAAAIRVLRAEIAKQKAAARQIENYMEYSEDINKLNILNDESSSAKLDSILKNIANVAEPYRSLLFKMLIAKVDTMNPTVDVKVARQKILQAEKAPNLDYIIHAVKSSFEETHLNAHHRVKEKVGIIYLHNKTAGELDDRSKAVNAITYIMANGERVMDKHNYTAIYNYNEYGQGNLKFVKNGDNYELNIHSDGKDNSLGITVSADVAAYLLGRSYVNMAELGDTEIRNLFIAAAGKHKENYRFKGGKSGHSLAMKVALGDMEDWTNLTVLYLVDKKAFAKGNWNASNRLAISKRGREELTKKYESELKPLIVKYYTGLDSKYLVNGEHIDYDLVMADFLDGKLEIGLNNVYINSPDDHKAMVLLKEQINLLRNNNVKTIGKPIGAADVKPEGEASASGGISDVKKDIEEKTKDVTVKKTGLNGKYKQGDKLNAYKDELIKNGYSIVEQNGKKIPFFHSKYPTSKCYVIRKGNDEFLLYETKNGNIGLANRKDGKDLFSTGNYTRIN